MPLETEIRYYESIKENLLAHHKDKFVLIKGDKLVDIFDSENLAIEEGFKKFGLDSFLVKQIKEIEEPEYIPALTHNLLHVHS